MAERYSKSMVVVLAYDPEQQLMHTTTYGVDPADKEQAADVGEMCTRLVCGDGFEQRRMYEDFRHVDAAERAQQIEKCSRVLTSAYYAIGSLLAVRDGMTDQALISLQREIVDAIGNEPTPAAPGEKIVESPP